MCLCVCILIYVYYVHACVYIGIDTPTYRFIARRRRQPHPTALCSPPLSKLCRGAFADSDVCVCVVSVCGV